MAVQCTAVCTSNTYVPDHICFSPICCTLGSHLVKMLITMCFGCAGFLLYVVSAIAVTLVFMLHIAPAHGTTSIYVYITICSLVGSLSVMSCKVYLTQCLSLICLILHVCDASQTAWMRTWGYVLTVRSEWLVPS